MVILLVILIGLLVGIFFCLIEIVGTLEKIRQIVSNVFEEPKYTYNEGIGDNFEATFTCDSGTTYKYKDGVVTEVKE